MADRKGDGIDAKEITERELERRMSDPVYVAQRMCRMAENLSTCLVSGFTARGGFRSREEELGVVLEAVARYQAQLFNMCNPDSKFSIDRMQVDCEYLAGLMLYVAQMRTMEF